MRAKITFEGTFQAYFPRVEPNDIVLEGTVLTIQGREIPIADQYLFSAVSVFAHAAASVKAEMTAIIEGDGNMLYSGYNAVSKTDYFLGKILGAGAQKQWSRLAPGSLPNADTYLVGSEYL